MPCTDCREKTYKMRFIGYDDAGKLIRTAPSGYSRGHIQENPLSMADLVYWELTEGMPDLVIPEVKYEESVFMEEIFVPEEPEDEADEEPEGTS